MKEDSAAYTDKNSKGMSSALRGMALARHSDEIDEIITKVPSWILRWGIILFAGILFMALSISAIIRYPDTINIPVNLQQSPKATEALGLLYINQERLTKLKVGQQVLVSLKVYPVEEYGKLKGQIINISDEPNEHGVFMVKVKLATSGMKQPVKIKIWMTGQAEVITQNITLLQRITRSLIKI